MEPIKVKFNESEYSAFIKKLQSCKGQAQAFINSIRGICRLDVTPAILKDLYSGKGERTVLAIEEAVTADLDRAGISSATVRSAAIRGDVEKFYSLYKHIQRMEGRILQCLTVTDNEVLLKPRIEENLKEQFTSYITTERGKLVYDKQVAMVNAINEFLELIPGANSLNVPEFYGRGTGDFRVHVSDIAYDMLGSLRGQIAPGQDQAPKPSSEVTRRRIRRNTSNRAVAGE